MKSTIGLNVIMKNEAKVLLRMLNSVCPILDYYVIVDTGSTDNSKQIVKDFFESKNIPGEIFDHPFINFEDARNFALEKGRGKTDFSFMIDCDEELIIPAGFDIDLFKKIICNYDKVSTMVNFESSIYPRPSLLRTTKPFKWKGEVHEYITCDVEARYFTSELITLVRSDGASWEDVKKKYLNHVAILEKSVIKNNDPRDIFYLAQSYKDSNIPCKAIEWYRNRINRFDGYYGERYYSQWMIGNLLCGTPEPVSNVLMEYFRCQELDPLRGEHILNICVEFQNLNMWQMAYLFSSYGMERYHSKLPTHDALFINKATYVSAILDAHILNCEKLNKTEEIMQHLKQVKKYQFTNHWFESQKPVVKKMLDTFDKEKPISILEIGVHEGRSTVFYIDNYLSHPDSKIVCVDPFDCGDSTSPVNNSTVTLFEHNLKLTSFPSKATVIKEYSVNAFAKLIEEKFDFISIDGSHLSKDVLFDAKESFKLLKENGIIFFDDYMGGDDSRDTNMKWPKIGIDSFLAEYAGQYTLLHKDYSVAIKKTAVPNKINKVYDCFLFFNEVDMLRLRLKELKDCVDVFILTESKYTFSGQEKPLCFSQIKDEFKDYNIVHIVVEDYVPGTAWDNEAYQRNSVKDYLLVDMMEDDICCLCDIDEIPNTETILSIKNGSSKVPTRLEMDFYYYNTNWLKKTKWRRASIVTLNELRSSSIEEIRNISPPWPTAKNGGWHFSYFMGVEQISKKINSFSHQEFNKDEFTNLEHIQKCIDSGIDLFDRGDKENLMQRTTEKLPNNILTLNN